MAEERVSYIDVSQVERTARHAWYGWRWLCIAAYPQLNNVIYHSTIGGAQPPFAHGMFPTPVYVDLIGAALFIALFAYALAVSGSFMLIGKASAWALSVIAILPAFTMSSDAVSTLWWLVPGSPDTWGLRVGIGAAAAMAFSAVQAFRYRRLRLDSTGQDLAAILETVRRGQQGSRRLYRRARPSLAGAAKLLAAVLLFVLSGFVAVNPHVVVERLYCNIMYGLNHVSCMIDHRAMDLIQVCSWLLFAVALGALFSGVLLWRSGLRRIRYGALQVLQSERRAPALLLRSFQDDGLSVRPKSWLTRALLRRRRLEEVVADPLSRWGPFIAIGQPGEALPALGAYRAYFEDDEWQPAVASWIRECQIVVVILGVTEWLQWEIRATLDNEAAAKLLILVPPEPSDAPGSRRRALIAALAGTAWEPASKALEWRDIRALRLRGSGELLALRSTGRSESHYEVATLVAAHDILARSAVRLSISRWPGLGAVPG